MYRFLSDGHCGKCVQRTMDEDALNLENVPIGGVGLMMRRKIMEELGYMDENLTMFSDHELYCRFFEKYVGRIIPYRVGIDKPASPESVRRHNSHKAAEELAYVRAKHPLVPPPATGKITIGNQQSR